MRQIRQVIKMPPSTLWRAPSLPGELPAANINLALRKVRDCLLAALALGQQPPAHSPALGLKGWVSHSSQLPPQWVLQEGKLRHGAPAWLTRGLKPHVRRPPQALFTAPSHHPISVCLGAVARGVVPAHSECAPPRPAPCYLFMAEQAGSQ